jgi:hypothetical protein
MSKPFLDSKRASRQSAEKAAAIEALFIQGKARAEVRAIRGWSRKYMRDQLAEVRKLLGRDLPGAGARMATSESEASR